MGVSLHGPYPNLDGFRVQGLGSSVYNLDIINVPPKPHSNSQITIPILTPTT